MELGAIDPVGPGEHRVRISEGFRLAIDDVRSKLRKEKGRVRGRRIYCVRHHGQYLVVDVDQREGVFCNITVPRNHYRYRLSDVAHGSVREWHLGGS